MIQTLRRVFLTILFLSAGTPNILAADAASGEGQGESAAKQPRSSHVAQAEFYKARKSSFMRTKSQRSSSAASAIQAEAGAGAKAGAATAEASASAELEAE